MCALAVCSETKPFQHAFAVLPVPKWQCSSIPHFPTIILGSSSNVLKLHFPCSKRLWGGRAFSVATPQMRSNLPVEIRAAPSVNILKSLDTPIFTAVNHTFCAMRPVVEWRNTNLMVEYKSND